MIYVLYIHTYVCTNETMEYISTYIYNWANKPANQTIMDGIYVTATESANK